MKRLIVIEGFDRCGKDTLLDDIENADLGFYVYRKKVENLPKYDTEKEKFMEWLDKFIAEQVKELNELFNHHDNIVMTRFIVSDEVYSLMFNRKRIVVEHLKDLRKDVEIKTHCLLFKDYQEYLKRLDMIGDREPQYTALELNKLNSFFVMKSGVRNVRFIEAEKKREEVLNDFIQTFRPIKELREKMSIANRVFESIIQSKELNDLIAAYKGEKLPRVIFSGVGKNWYICEKVVKTYLSLGIQAEALDCVHALHGDLGMLMSDEPKLLIFVSKSGTTEELRRLVRVVSELREKGIIKNLSIVGFYLNKREKIEMADRYDSLILLPHWIEYKDFPEFDERNLVPTLSINTMQMVIDYLGIKLYESREDLVESYVYNHLGGNNGKALNSDKLIRL